MTAAAQFDGGDPMILGHEPERTSISAILSLVLGLLGCCTLVTAPIGLVLAIVGIIGISRSQGRVGGMGFSIAGLLISLLAIVLWLGALFGVQSMFAAMTTHVSEPVAEILRDIEADKFDDARSAMSPPASELSDEELAAFRDAYTAKLGGVVSTPSGVGEYFSAYMSLGQRMQTLQGRNDFIPIPLRFDNGWGLVIMVFDPSAAQQNSQGAPVPIELIIFDESGFTTTLPASQNNAAPAQSDADAEETDAENPDAESPDAENTDQGSDP